MLQETTAETKQALNMLIFKQSKAMFSNEGLGVLVLANRGT